MAHKRTEGTELIEAKENRDSKEFVPDDEIDKVDM